jgi:hypothetical protein
VTRIGWDYDHDGRADRWDRIDRIAPMRLAAAGAAAGVPTASVAGSAVMGASGSPAPASNASAPPPAH